MEPAGGLEVDLSPEEMKEAEREVIQRQIETTEAQLEAMEKLEEEGTSGDMLDDATVQALKVNNFLWVSNLCRSRHFTSVYYIRQKRYLVDSLPNTARVKEYDQDHYQTNCIRM